MDMDKRYLSVIKACALSLLLVGVGGLSSCNSDDIKEDAMYTFTGETVASFCEKTPESVSYTHLTLPTIRLQSCPSFIN